VQLVRADDADVAGPEPVGLARDRQLHDPFANQHHLLAQVLVRRMVHLARRDVALMRFDLEAGVGLGREHPLLPVLAVGRDRQLVVLEVLRAHHRQPLDRVVRGRGRALLRVERRGPGGDERRK
jgi:hypothetical protein